MPKMKTHSGAKKRFRFTASGKIKRSKQNKNHILITDEPFICLICDAEKIPHMSAIHFLFSCISSHEKILSYLEKIEATNYLNYFNVGLYKKIFDSLEKISLKERKEFEIRDYFI